MPLWLTALIAAARAFFARWLGRKADADFGAAQQREADRKGDAEAARRAKETFDGINALSDDELRERIGRRRERR